MGHPVEGISTRARKISQIDILIKSIENYCCNSNLLAVGRILAFEETHSMQRHQSVKESDSGNLRILS